MAEESQQKKLTLEEPMVSMLTMPDVLAKLLIAKGVITDEEFEAQLGAERGNYLAVLKRLRHRRAAVARAACQRHAS